MYNLKEKIEKTAKITALAILKETYSIDAEIEASVWVFGAKIGGGYEKVITKTITVTGLKCCVSGDPNTDYCSPFYVGCPT